MRKELESLVLNENTNEVKRREPYVLCLSIFLDWYQIEGGTDNVLSK
jgi:hypothetical protein